MVQKIDLSQFESDHFIVRAMKHTEHKRNHFTFGEYLSQVWDSSCKKIKSVTFLITDVKISHDKALTSFVQQEWLHCVNSPVCFVIFPAMTLNPELHHKSTSSFQYHPFCFMNTYVNYWIIPENGQKLSPF